MSLFEWDDGNILHIARHGVTPEEAEEALISSIEDGSRVLNGETHFESIGQTKRGRILRVISVDRGELYRVVTAFDAPARDKRTYLLSMVNL